MNEKPILFNAEMVRAILDGRKTQTRRPIKPQPKHRVVLAEAGLTHGLTAEECKDDGSVFIDADGINPGRVFYCPYGTVGDRLWVRETFSFNGIRKQGNEVYYATKEKDVHNPESFKWTPSIHMPRWASRITLEITGVRVERVQDIIPSDAQKEGCPFRYSGFSPEDAPDMVGWFRDVWNKAYPESWERNDWVWVIEFKRI